MAWKLVPVALLVALLGLGVYAFLPMTSTTRLISTSDVDDAEQIVDAPSAVSLAERNEKFATMMAFQGGLGFSGNKELEDLAWTGWNVLRNSSSWDTYYAQLIEHFATNADLVTQTGFSSNRDVVGSFAWNVIQPTEGGDYDWTMPDATMTYAGEAGVTISAVVYPYGSWQTDQDIETQNCAGIDFAFFDSRVGYPTDSAAYRAFLTALVERYDGDGIDDMPGLSTRVEAWEVGNEVEGPCVNSSAEDYVAFLQTSYETIKAADEDTLVANAGALEIIGHTGRIQATIDFWQEFFALGGADYVDVFTVHYNAERSELKNTSDDFEENMAFFRNLLDEYDADATPMWLTEFGLPTSSGYRTYVGIGDDLGVQRYFIDLMGGNQGLGVSALFEGNAKARDFLSVLQEL